MQSSGIENVIGWVGNRIYGVSGNICRWFQCTMAGRPTTNKSYMLHYRLRASETKSQQVTQCGSSTVINQCSKCWLGIGPFWTELNVYRCTWVNHKHFFYRNKVNRIEHRATEMRECQTLLPLSAAQDV